MSRTFRLLLVCVLVGTRCANTLAQELGSDLVGADIQFISLLQQPPSLSTPSVAPPGVRRTTGTRQSGLASVPNMFGDLAGATSTLLLVDTSDPDRSSSLTLPIGGGGSRIGKISENDSPIPQDRVFFNYNHFHNAVEVNQPNPNFPPPQLFSQGHLDRYTLGFEKTFFEGDASVEVRMPLMSTINEQLEGVGLNADNVGNLTLVFKSLVYFSDALAIGAGLAVETPTGSDLFLRLGTTRLRFQNETVHLLPYMGFIWSPGDPRWGWGSGLFLTGYAQIDINTSGNAIEVVGPGNMTTATVGKLTDQNLAFFDIGAGYWLYRDPEAPRLTGIAAVTELHYTTSLQDADIIQGTADGMPVALNTSGGSLSVLNATAGVQILLFDATSFRLAGAFPIGGDDRRFFDSEVQVQLNRRF